MYYKDIVVKAEKELIELNQAIDLVKNKAFIYEDLQAMPELLDKSIRLSRHINAVKKEETIETVYKLATFLRMSPEDITLEPR